MAFTPKTDGWKLYAVYYLNTRSEIWAPNEGLALKWIGMRYNIAPGHEARACRAFDITTT
jgi:hypothetical protein